MEEMIRRISGELMDAIQEAREEVEKLQTATYKGHYKDRYRAEGRFLGLTEADRIVRRYAIDHCLEDFLEGNRNEEDEWTD